MKAKDGPCSSTPLQNHISPPSPFFFLFPLPPSGYSPGHIGQHWSGACVGLGHDGGGQTTGSQITVRLCRQKGGVHWVLGVWGRRAPPQWPFPGTYLAGAEGAKGVVVGCPASSMRALLPLKKASVGITGPPVAPRLGGQWGVWAQCSGQSCRCCSGGCRGPRSPSCRQTQAACLALVGNVHLGGGESETSPQHPMPHAPTHSSPGVQ